MLRTRTAHLQSMTSSLTAALSGAAGSFALTIKGARLACCTDRGFCSAELVKALATGTPVKAVAMLMFARQTIVELKPT